MDSKIFLAIVLSFLSTIAFCEQKLIVWLKSGQSVEYQLSLKPKTTFEGNELVLIIATMEVRYLLSQISKYTYAEDNTGIETALADKRLFLQSESTLSFSHVKEETSVSIYSFDGRLLYSTSILSGQSKNIDLSAYPIGVYIIKVNDLSYKIAKK